MPAADDRIDLQQAAERLGVHYQTVYRWVRAGRLSAQMVGGRYLVDPQMLDAVDRDRLTPRTPTEPGSPRVQRQAQCVHDALIEGDESAVRTIAATLAREGARLASLLQTLFVPALRSIGQAWHDGDLPIWVEHRATAIVERVLGELAPNPRGRRRGVAVVAAVAGDQHSLPTAMAAMVLREHNWFVHHLGADMPVDDLIRFCGSHDIDIAVISMTNPDVADDARAAAEGIRLGGTAAIVGAPGRTLDDLVAEVSEAATDVVRAT